MMWNKTELAGYTLHETMLSRLAKEIKDLDKQLYDTTSLYETCQDNYELLLEKHNSLEQEYNKLEEDFIEEKLESWEIYQDKETYKEKYNKLLGSHASVMEENVCLGIKLENQEANNKQMLEAKDKFYNVLLKHPVQIKYFLDELNKQDELSENNTLIFCTKINQAIELENLIKSYNNVTLDNRGNNYMFPNGARLFVKVVTNVEEAYTNYGGLVGNNVLVNTGMKSDVELCQWACSRARYTGKGYQPAFIAYYF